MLKAWPSKSYADSTKRIETWCDSGAQRQGLWKGIRLYQVAGWSFHESWWIMVAFSEVTDRHIFPFTTRLSMPPWDLACKNAFTRYQTYETSLTNLGLLTVFLEYTRLWSILAHYKPNTLLGCENVMTYRKCPNHHRAYRILDKKKQNLLGTEQTYPASSKWHCMTAEQKDAKLGPALWQSKKSYHHIPYGCWFESQLVHF